MQLAHRTDNRRPANPIAAFGLALALGLGWISTELVLSIASGRVLVPAYTLDRFWVLLPWQLALFSVIGAGVAAIVRWHRLGLAAAVWLTLGSASFLFLGEAIAEGLLRRARVLDTALGLGLLAAGLLGGGSFLAWARRLLPPAWQTGWYPAVWTGWTLFFLLWMQHSVRAIRRWSPDWRVLVDFLEPEHPLVGLSGAAVVLIAGRLLSRARTTRATSFLVLVASTAFVPTTHAKLVSERPDVLVILVDTWRYDHLGVTGGRPELTPALDALAAESILFTRAFSPGNFTKLALPGIHTSLPAKVTGLPLPEEVTTLSEHLREAGWSTYGISTNPYVTEAFGYGQGFDFFFDTTSINNFLIEGILEALGAQLSGFAYRAGILNSSLYYTPADLLRKRAVEFFEQSETPTFVYLHTMDPHGPYLPPRRYLPDRFDFDTFTSYFDFDDLKGKEILDSPEYAPRLENLRQRYRGEVRFTDEALGALIEDLQRLGRWDEMLVWVLSDHGEAFGEHNWAGHSGFNLSRILTQVPLMLKLPQSWGIPARNEETLVSSFDLVPTTLGLLGLGHAQEAFGSDISELVLEGRGDPDRLVVTVAGPHVYAAVRWPWKLDVHVDPEMGRIERRALYHLGRDPGEKVDVSKAHPGVVRRLQEDLSAWWERESRLRKSRRDAPINPVVREQLRSLGYAE